MRAVLRSVVLIVVLCSLAGTAWPATISRNRWHRVTRGDSVVLWTRIDSPERPKALLLEVATDAAFADVVVTRCLRGPTTTTA